MHTLYILANIISSEGIQKTSDDESHHVKISIARMSVRHSNRELDSFRERHRLQHPSLRVDNMERKQLDKKNGLRLLESAPATNVLTGQPPLSQNESGCYRYLWVIDAKGIPYIIESPITAIGCLMPKHTNLTGGTEAYLGGEMWFASQESLYISGGSGRYPPEDEQQFKEAVEVFESFNYAVRSLGWDNEAGRAKRYAQDSKWKT